MSSYGDFVRGRFEGISLSRDGRLSLAPKLDTVFTSDQPVIWSVAQAPDGTLYAATGHRGRRLPDRRAGKATLLWTAEQPEVFAIAVDRSGAVYAGTSPDGKVYRIENGQGLGVLRAQCPLHLVAGGRARWRAVRGHGRPGQGVSASTAAGKGEIYYDTGQAHITGLAVDSQGRLLAGTEPNGILYRISAKDKAFVLYDSDLPEIRAIVPMPDGTVYAAGAGRLHRPAGTGRRPVRPGRGRRRGHAHRATTITVEAQSRPARR